MSDRAGMPREFDADLSREPEPPDGPDDEPTLAELADQAAEAIRSLNHRTMPGRDLEYPADVYAIVGTLKVMADRLPQLLRQLSAWLEAEHKAGRAGHDSGQDPGPYVGDVTAALTLAATVAGTLSDALRLAHNASSGIKSADLSREPDSDDDSGGLGDEPGPADPEAAYFRGFGDSSPGPWDGQPDAFHSTPTRKGGRDGDDTADDQ
jgi:hypothetical protein